MSGKIIPCQIIKNKSNIKNVQIRNFIKRFLKNNKKKEVSDKQPDVKTNYNNFLKLK